MEPQRLQDIKNSLHDMEMEELETMYKDLNNLIQVLVTRMVAVEDTILDRLEAAFRK
jgi:hypothetical protein